MNGKPGPGGAFGGVSAGLVGIGTWKTAEALHDCPRLNGVHFEFRPGLKVAMFVMLNWPLNLGDTIAVIVNVTLPKGATLTRAPVIAPVPEVGATADPVVAVADQAMPTIPAGVGSTTTPLPVVVVLRFVTTTV